MFLFLCQKEVVRLHQGQQCPGKINYSDCWKAYECLSQEGCQHLTVNHSLTFKDPETGGHTNSIGDGQKIKHGLHFPRFGVTEKHLGSYLAKHLWCSQNRGREVFENFLVCAAHIYNGTCSQDNCSHCCVSSFPYMFSVFFLSSMSFWCLLSVCTACNLPEIV